MRQIRQAVILLGLATAAFCGQEVSTWKDVPLANPSFEEGKAIPDGWRILKGNTSRRSLPTVIAWDKEFAHAGKRSVYILKEDGGPVRLRSSVAVPVVPGQTYLLEGWVRTTGVGRFATASIGAANDSKGPDGKPWAISKEFGAGAEINPAWQKVTLEFVPPDWVKNFFVTLINSSSARDGYSVEFWFDDFSLKQKPTPGSTPEPK